MDKNTSELLACKRLHNIFALDRNASDILYEKLASSPWTSKSRRPVAPRVIRPQGAGMDLPHFGAYAGDVPEPCRTIRKT